MESIEKLRELAVDVNTTEIIDHLDVVGKFMLRTDWLDSWHKAFDAACDEIEREIAERYMELPLDADGMPVRIGDLVTNPFFEGSREVRSLTKEQGNPDWHLGVDEGKVTAHTCRHAKPRTVEDVLEGFAHNYNSIGGKPDEDELWDKLLADTSAELREMITYVPERTCYSERDDIFVCSECGFLDAFAAPYDFNYCPKCGAKVVNE